MARSCLFLVALLVGALCITSAIQRVSCQEVQGWNEKDSNKPVRRVLLDMDDDAEPEDLDTADLDEDNAVAGSRMLLSEYRYEKTKEERKAEKEAKRERKNEKKAKRKTEKEDKKAKVTERKDKRQEEKARKAELKAERKLEKKNRHYYD